MTMTNSMTEPFAILGLDAGASGDEIRARYLQLVRENPPERDADRFEVIRDAYEQASNPVARWTRRIVSNELMPLDDLLASFQSFPERMPTRALLRVGDSISRTNP